MKNQMLPFFRGLLLTGAAVSLVSCATAPNGAYAPASSAAYGEVGVARTKPKSRPGLATQAGDERLSSVDDLAFFRKSTGQPDVVDSFNYNDEDGAKAMADALGGGRKRRGSFSAAGGRLEVGLCSGSWSSPLDRYEARDRRIVVGESGSSYQIFLTNRTKHAVEVVASVDGLDVMDGKTAAVRKRGYVVPAKSELAIEGFRVNAAKVKQFVFGRVDDSAAAKAGQARNVGVIGLAVYDEDEAQAQLARLMESQKRSAANPFAAAKP
jgi:hypothetical protein